LKGFGRGEGNSIELISKIIEKNLQIQCNVLMGANLANEVAEDKFCETTIGEYYCNLAFKLIIMIRHGIAGCKDKRLAPVLRDLIQTINFRVIVVEDSETVEVCGALKVYEEINKIFVNYILTWRHFNYLNLSMKFLSDT